MQRLKESRQVLLDSLFEVINAANTLGYENIVANLGAHEKLVVALITSLIDCVKTEDYLGKLPKAIFLLLSRQSVSEELLKKLKFESIQKRWLKRGDDDIKKQIAEIQANTTEAKEKANKEKAVIDEKKKKLKSQVELPKPRNPVPTKTALPSTSTSTSTKRALDSDSATGQPTKKFASDGTTFSKIIPAKRQTNGLAGLLGSKAAATKPVVKRREPSPPRSSKLAGILDEIAKPREPPKAPEPPPGPPETPEQKKKRERKESRAHLRVKWKEGPDLEQIRLFTHEQAEDEGRQHAMLRDAHDAHSEGMMLKKRNPDDMDGDTNIDSANEEYGEVDIRPYLDLKEVDFSVLEASKSAMNYTTRGGKKAVESAEQKKQEKREALELMVIYTDPKDIPPSPKEPSFVAEDSQEVKDIGRPEEKWLVSRLRDIELYGPERSLQMLLRNLQTYDGTPKAENTKRGITDHASTSAPIMIHPPNSAHDGYIPGGEADAWGYLNRILDDSGIRGKAFPASEPPQWMSEHDKANWWGGYHVDKAAMAKRLEDKKLAEEAVRMQAAPMVPQYEMPLPAVQTYSAPPQPAPMSYIAPPVPDVTQQVTNILANLGNDQQNGNGTPPRSYDPVGWSTNNGNSNTTDNSPSTRHEKRKSKKHGINWDGGRDTGRDMYSESMYDEPEEPKPKRVKDRGFDMKQYAGGVPENEAAVSQYKGKKKPCTFFREGRCAKGRNCTFLHE